MRIVSGVQPTGRLHLGNYFGAIRQQLALQDQGEVLLFIADLHALTTLRDPSRLAALTRDIALDYLALGLDPAKAMLFRQSDVPEVAELAWILAAVTGMGLLERAHAYKDKLAHGLPASVGLFLYPILMASDILIYRADVVPVGADQRQHLEITRDVARAFNAAYGEVFALPRERVEAATAIVPGIDGRKMSKSYGNTIGLTSSADEIRALVMTMFTDPERIRRKDPGRPDVCNLFQFHKLFSNGETIARVDHECRTAQIGCVDDKKLLAEIMIESLRPIREKREEIDRDPSIVWDVLREGNRKARERAAQTMELVRDAIKINYRELR